MKSAIHPIMLGFLAVFVAACVAVVAYHYFYIWPQQTCESHGDWWDEQDKVCAVPMPIWTFTHRMPGEAKPVVQPAAKPAAAAPARPKA